jgi:adenylyltransferase/sulfurtransferase
MIRNISFAVAILATMLAGGLLSRAQEEPAQQPTRIAVSELKQKLDRGDKFLLIDVREDQELEQDGAIPGAIHISMGELDQRMKDIPKDVEIVFYCASGGRASRAAEKFMKAGYRAGPFCGIRDWKKENQKVAPTAERPASGPIRPKP